LHGSKKKYRNNLPPPEDTTTRGGQAPLTPGFLRYVGELLFGERWQTPLAHSLGQARGKPLSPATVHRWSMARRSIPGWVMDALAFILENGQRDLDRRAGMASAIATRIRNLAPGDRPVAVDRAEKQHGRDRQDSFH
jgi:hypothetical protein